MLLLLQQCWFKSRLVLQQWCMDFPPFLHISNEYSQITCEIHDAESRRSPHPHDISSEEWSSKQVCIRGVIAATQTLRSDAREITVSSPHRLIQNYWQYTERYAVQAGMSSARYSSLILEVPRKCVHGLLDELSRPYQTAFLTASLVT